jgi:hypothetical protein
MINRTVQLEVFLLEWEGVYRVSVSRIPEDHDWTTIKQQFIITITTPPVRDLEKEIDAQCKHPLTLEQAQAVYDEFFRKHAIGGGTIT